MPDCLRWMFLPSALARCTACLSPSASVANTCAGPRCRACSLVQLLGQYNYAGEQAQAEWMQNWEDVWQDNLSRCEEGRSAPCKVVVS